MSGGHTTCSVFFSGNPLDLTIRGMPLDNRSIHVQCVMAAWANQKGHKDHEVTSLSSLEYITMSGPGFTVKIPGADHIERVGVIESDCRGVGVSKRVVNSFPHPLTAGFGTGTGTPMDMIAAVDHTPMDMIAAVDQRKRKNEVVVWNADHFRNVVTKLRPEHYESLDDCSDKPLGADRKIFPWGEALKIAHEVLQC